MSACVECGREFAQGSDPGRKAILCGDICRRLRKLRQMREAYWRRPEVRQRAAVKARARERVREQPVQIPLSGGGPRPVAAELSGTPDRQVWCVHYDDCLDLAVRAGWESWACASCPIRGTCDISQEERIKAAMPTASSGALAVDGDNIKVVKGES